MTQEPRSPDVPDDVIPSIGDGEETEIKIKGSRFIGRAWSSRTEEEARERVDRVRRLHHDARHVCWAFRLGPPESALERFDDDGEPGGTAGTPILNAIARSGPWFATVTVTRYFGGVKLGAGGLARAYGESARAALVAAPSSEIWRETLIRVETTFDDVGLVEAVLARRGNIVRRVERTFEPGPGFAIAVPRSRAETLRAELVEATAGRAITEVDAPRLVWP